jgi:hypothetical protein
MDVEKALRELYQEKNRLDAVIAQLEIKERSGVHEVQRPRTRGRKSMTPEERLAVSRRMTVYWAERKLATA